MKTLTKKYIQEIYRPREATSDKGTHGHALIIAGQKGMMGCAVIAAKACLRSGVGLLTVSVPPGERSILQTALPEAMLHLRGKSDPGWERFAAVAIGPGIGTGKKALQLLEELIAQGNKPVVIDADALNVIATQPELLPKLPVGSILTPHLKEFDRLFGSQSSHEQRVTTAIEMTRKHPFVIVLKGPKTIITHDGAAFHNTTGNAGLAKGGSGDALTGIITAFLAQGYSPLDAATLGVYLHGAAADLALKEQSMESMLISDVIGKLGEAFLGIVY